MYATDSQFNSLLASGGTFLVDFSAQWCSPCSRLSPIIDRIASEFSGRCTVAKMDIDQTSSHRRLGIQSVPTLVLFKGGNVVWKHEGLITEAALRSALSSKC